MLKVWLKISLNACLQDLCSIIRLNHKRTHEDAACISPWSPLVCSFFPTEFSKVFSIFKYLVFPAFRGLLVNLRTFILISNTILGSLYSSIQTVWSNMEIIPWQTYILASGLFIEYTIRGCIQTSNCIFAFGTSRSPYRFSIKCFDVKFNLLS